MELKHSFTVPAGLDETWSTFGDLASVAECFPGATVTESDGETFKGTAKIKLGPVALQYSGAGEILSRDESSHTMRLEAKGKDKRGNGTAGATVSMAFAAEDASTSRVDVTTDLAITGKAAQFGARMMQEVSDKLLGQFVDCLQARVGAGAPPPVGADDPVAAASSPEGAAVGAEAPEATPATPEPDAGTTGARPDPGPTAQPAAARQAAAPRPAPPAGDDALDLGATVLPVIARMYGKQIVAGVLALVVLRWLWGRRG
ncbi:SRPBCC domain-containing protein [Nocardioides marmoribigeumensis]|uniref:Carbon monoxide dehydrogenase subunit G n=1 Tax=Nocardioides marmoribigeumensis TaxID=433649 RepID=A0ABU2BSI0_9ACTN|nr:SRPBCC domain-containing protein [Nocardioides marmoribigeumensis]MDR7361595.1 carbon monoxide dehydrogenase subunit G [Nocardioides marmoribigeumensis]